MGGGGGDKEKKQDNSIFFLSGACYCKLWLGVRMATR